MKKFLPVAIVLVIVAAIFGSTYNRLNQLSRETDGAWAQVENAMQRRADLIPNLVETVKGYANHEEEVFTKVTEARSGIKNADTPQEMAAANEQMNEALRNINVVVEAYPELKANENFQNLQAELAGTENRLAVERQRYNESVTQFNLAVTRFPTNLVAGLLGFQERQYFEANPEAHEAPQVQF